MVESSESAASLDELAPAATHPWVAEGAHRVRFGFDVGPQPDDLSELIDVVLHAEAEGMDGYWCYDHPLLRAECWTTLAALAAKTTTIRLASSMSCIYYRSPYMLARQAADVDRLSGGRLVLGLGVGDMEPEFRRMGLQFPKRSTRHRDLLETVRILRGLWSGKQFEHHGERWSATCEAGEFFGPVQTPHVPIVIGGGGERYTLPDVAHFADASNMGPLPITGGAASAADITRKFARLQACLEERGRSYESVLRSYYAMLVMGETPAAAAAKYASRQVGHGATAAPPGIFVGGPDEVIAHYQGLAGLGFQYFVSGIAPSDRETVALMCRYVLPAFN